MITFPRFANCLQLPSQGMVNSYVSVPALRALVLSGGPGGLDSNLLFCKLFKAEVNQA